MVANRCKTKQSLLLQQTWLLWPSFVTSFFATYFGYSLSFELFFFHWHWLFHRLQVLYLALKCISNIIWNDTRNRITHFWYNLELYDLNCILTMCNFVITIPFATIMINVGRKNARIIKEQLYTIPGIILVDQFGEQLKVHKLFQKWNKESGSLFI